MRGVMPRPAMPGIKLPFCVFAALISGCASRPALPVSAPLPVRAPPVVSDALALRGLPYRAGGDSPRTGFDCSGLVWYVYAQHGLALPRNAAAMAEALPQVPWQQRQPGDLVFFNTTGQLYSHVGIYVGNDQFVHAPSRRSGQVRVSNLGLNYWTKRFLGLRRPLPSGIRSTAKRALQ